MTSGWSINDSVCIPVGNYATTNVNYTTFNVHENQRNTVIWNVDICIHLLQNPHPVLALIYYSSKFLLFIEKLCRVKRRWPLCWGEWKHSNGKWQRVQHPLGFHHFPTFFQQPWTNISGPTDAHRHLRDEALMLLLCSKKKGLCYPSRIKGLHVWSEVFLLLLLLLFSVSTSYFPFLFFFF